MTSLIKKGMWNVGKFAALCLVLFAGVHWITGNSVSLADGDATYVGSQKCQSCHSSPKKGDQFGKWLKEKHSKAYIVLASDESKKLAATKNIADAQKSDACLKCHVTAFGVPAEAKGKKFDVTLGVQCETCHGPGSKHVEARLKADDPEDNTKLVEIGKDELVEHPSAETCRKCHNKDSPNYKPFAYAKYLKEIEHLDPRKGRPADYIDKLPADPKDDPDAAKIEFKK